MKHLFTFQPDHVLDIITNSSSELFVLKGQTLAIVESMVRSVYANYDSEYESIKPTSDLTIDEIQTYLSYAYIHYSEEPKMLSGFSFDEMFEKSERWTNLKWGFVTEENKAKVVKAMDPTGDKFFMFSKDENPNWEMQEQLMEVGERYHLG